MKYLTALLIAGAIFGYFYVMNIYVTRIRIAEKRCIEYGYVEDGTFIYACRNNPICVE